MQDIQIQKLNPVFLTVANVNACTVFPLSDIFTHIVQTSIILTVLFGRFSETVIKAKGLRIKVGFSVFSGQSFIYSAHDLQHKIRFRYNKNGICSSAFV